MLTQHPGSGFTIWFTGMAVAGKRTLAKAVAERLRRIEKAVEYIDGPEWEQFIGRGPGETKEERTALMRRTGFAARVVTRAGGFAVVAQVSPYRETREGLRREIGRFLEVFVDCPIETLLQRDSGGLYHKAMRGEIRNFIGVTDPYEPPAAPEVRYDSSKMTPDEGAALVLEALVREGGLTPTEAGLARTPRKEKKPRGGKAPSPILFTAAMLQLPKPQPRPEPRPAAKASPAKPEVKAAPAKPEVKAATKAPAKPEAKAPAKAAAKPEAKAPAKVAPAKAPAKTTAKPEAKAPVKPAAKPAPAKAPVKAAAPAKAPAKPAPAKAAAKPAAKPAAKAGKKT
jgi:adenylylsulfate kinase